MKRWLARFERDYGYDASYARAILDADTGALLKFARIEGLAKYRKDVPAAAWYAAGLTSTLAEDCGPCTQLVVTMAEREGLEPAMLKAILTGDKRSLPEEVLLGMRFAQTVLAHDPAADDLRAEVVRRWGERALISLAFSITVGRIYPTIKYALGYGQACQRVTVGGASVAMLKRAA
jgi:hypothetical protein